MSFELYEDSAEGGRPIELYEFYYLSQISRWTSWDRDITVGAFNYTRATLSRGDIAEEGQSTTNPNLAITCEPDFPIAALFSVAPPSDVVNVIIKRVQYSDLTDPKVIYSGRILNVSWPGDSCKITCQSIFTRMKQPGLRRGYGKRCPHLHYKSGDGQCNVALVTYEEAALTTSVSGVTIQSNDFLAHPDGYYNGGKLEIALSAGNTERRGIKTHVGNTITITHKIPGLVAGMTVKVWPGCDHTRQTCIDKFNNEPNFGGFPFTPEKNPFGTSSVF